MKYEITRVADGFGGAKVPQKRIIEVAEGEPPPEGAVLCTDQTVAVTGWEHA